MSIGVLLVCVELIMMLIILLFVPREIAGASFIGFAIGESLGASALRIAGGIFTKIADIGSDLMKIVFGIKEDDPAILALLLTVPEIMPATVWAPPQTVSKPTVLLVWLWSPSLFWVYMI